MSGVYAYCPDCMNRVPVQGGPQDRARIMLKAICATNGCHCLRSYFTTAPDDSGKEEN